MAAWKLKKKKGISRFSEAEYVAVATRNDATSSSWNAQSALEGRRNGVLKYIYIFFEILPRTRISRYSFQFSCENNPKIGTLEKKFHFSTRTDFRSSDYLNLSIIIIKSVFQSEKISSQNCPFENSILTVVASYSFQLKRNEKR